MGKAVGGGARAGSRIGESLGAASSARAASRIGARQAGRGYLAPGDPTPSPTVSTDYLDYRGTATWNEVKNLEAGEFPLGAFIDFQRRRLMGPIGLPADLLNRHAIVVGPAGSGKTAGLLIPWIWSALADGWSVVAVDVKGDLKEDLVAYNLSLGVPDIPIPVRKWDFMDPQQSVVWEWMAELTDDARFDAAITAILGRRSENSTADPYFYQRDYRTLRGILSFSRALSSYVRTAGQVIRLLEADQRLADMVAANPRAPGAGDVAAVLRFPPHEYSKVISGVVTALSALDTPNVSTVMAAKPGQEKLDLESALDENQALIIGATLRGGQVSATLSSLMLNQLAQRLYERFGQKRRRVLLVIDEAAQVTDRVDIAQLMEVSRSAGAGVVVAFQDVAKIRDENDRSSILSNAATFAILPGSSPTSVREFGQRLGQRYEQTYSLSAGNQRSGWGSQVNQSFGTESVPVLRERETFQPPEGDRPVVLHIKAQELGISPKPFLVDLFRD
jgi:type IV secretory pathway TraG/TraD family ATPase VirD4